MSIDQTRKIVFEIKKMVQRTMRMEISNEQWTLEGMIAEEGMKDILIVNHHHANHP